MYGAQSESGGNSSVVGGVHWEEEVPIAPAETEVCAGHSVYCTPFSKEDERLATRDAARNLTAGT